MSGISASHPSMSTLSMARLAAADVQSAVESRSSGRGKRPIGVSTPSAVPLQRSKTHFSTRLFSPYPGQRKLPCRPAEPIDDRKSSAAWRLGREPILSQCAKVVAHVIAAEWQHRHGIAPKLADLAGGGGGGLAAGGRAEECAVCQLKTRSPGERCWRGVRQTGWRQSERRSGLPTRARSLNGPAR